MLGGCGTPRAAAPELRAAVECRHFRDAPPKVFDAAVETVFDTGYLVIMCDRRTGIVAGHDARDYREGLPSAQISVLVDGARGLVRVTPGHVGGHAPSDAEIGEFYRLMGERVTLEACAEGGAH
jgi:hypothetical protein